MCVMIMILSETLETKLRAQPFKWLSYLDRIDAYFTWWSNGLMIAKQLSVTIKYGQYHDTLNNEANNLLSNN
jgi:hypothetical protein